MRLQLTEIPPHGTQISFDPSTAWALRAAEVALEGPVQALTGAVEVHFDKRRHASGLLVSGAVDAAVTRSCDRCAREGLVLRIVEPLELLYVPDLGGAAGRSMGAAVGEVAAGELDLGLYAEGALDLSLVIQEHLALQLPARVTCETPGVTLPDGAACDDTLFRPSPPAPDPRWAALSGLKLGASSEREN